MNYSSLTKIQRNCIDAFVNLEPSLANATSISRKEVERLFKILFDARTETGVKIGYPMWLVKGKKAGRGVYVFPGPNVTLRESIANSSKASKNVNSSKEDEEFFADIAKAGLLEEVS
jgi:hypothetical protein